jgi:hypothetical protein
MKEDHGLIFLGVSAVAAHSRLQALPSPRPSDFVQLEMATI